MVLLVQLGSVGIRASCTFSGNTAGGGGGGMYNSSYSTTLTNCIFIGNSATNQYGGGGGGMYNQSPFSPTLNNCVFIDNSATTSGGGMYNNFSNPVLTNCIIWGNSPASPQIYQGGGTAIVTYSDIQQTSGVYTGAGNINADPVFVRNPSPGTDGMWDGVNDDYGDLRPQLTSPVIDAGNNAAVPAGVTKDMAGKPRFLDVVGVSDTGLGTAPIVDMGAYERGLVVTTTGTSASEQFSVGLTAGGATLQTRVGTGPVSSYAVNTVESCEFATGGGDDALTVDVSNGLPGIGVTFTAGDGKDTLVLTGTTAGQSMQVLVGQVLVGTAAIVSTNVEGIQLDGTAGGVVDVGTLTVGTNLAMTSGKNLVLRPGTLNITAGGTLDLAGNGMILNYGGASPVATVNQWIGNGRTGITPGLKTSGTVSAGTAALGMVDNALLHLGNFAGQSLGGVFSQLLIQPTVAGDANLDGVVNDADYLAVIANMGRTGAQWFLGDLNGDGTVNADDFAEVTAHLTAVAGFAAGPVLPANPTASAKAVVAKAVVKQGVKKAVAKTRAVKAKCKMRNAK